MFREAIEPSPSTDTDTTIKIRPLTTYHLRPPTGLDRSCESTVQPDLYMDQVNNLKGFTKSLSELKEAQKKLVRPADFSRDDEYPRFVFLGTGSCPSSARRNMSGILVHVT